MADPAGRVAAVANTHLPSDPYGPYLVRDGGTRDDVLALERKVRLPAVRDLARILPALARLLADDSYRASAESRPFRIVS